MGFIESLTFGLVSKDENYTNFRKKFNEDEAITLANPATIEFQQVRTSLLPGLMMTLKSNQKEPKPQRIFEISDTAVIDMSTDTGAKNIRRIALV